jgi:hypothetical protein
MPLDTNFDVSPYFDDYDPKKKYYRILYRPSVAVQARELTQTQTMIQSQIERFAGHVFTDGSRIDGCTPTVLPNLAFVRIADKFVGNNDLFIEDIPTNYLLVGNTSGVRATIEVAKEGLLINYPNTNRFYVKYISTGNPVGNDYYSTFANGEYINIYNDFQGKFDELDPQNIVYKTKVISTNSSILATGKGYGFKIEDGIVYQKGYFQIIDEQKIVIRDYDQDTSNTVVGFETEEEIVTENQDASLDDNALGYPNENAPGAHRLKLNPIIVAKERDKIANNDTFYAIFEFSNITGELLINRTNDPYSVMGDFIAARTFDESGDYVVKPFLTEATTSNIDGKFSYRVSSGKGYVHGKAVEYTASRSVDADKATTTNDAKAQIITANYGNYVRVKEFAGLIPISSLQQINIYNTPIQAITNNYPGSVAATVVGTAKVKSVIYDSGVAGTPDCVYRLYLTEILMNPGYSFAGSAKSFGLDNGPYGDFWADAVLVDNKAILDQTGKLSLVLPFGKKALKSLFVNGDYNTDFYFRTAVQSQLLTNGYISVTTSSSHPGGTDSIGYSVGILGDSLEKQVITTLQSPALTSNFTGVTANIFNVGSNQYANISIGNITNYFYPGEYIYVGGTKNRVDAIVNNSTVQLAQQIFAPVASTAFAKFYPAGYIVPLDNNLSGGARYVNVTSPTTMGIVSGVGNTTAPLTAAANVVVQLRMARSNAQPAKKEVIRNVFVKLNLSNNAGGVNGPWKLGLPDVFQINNVWANPSNYSTAISDDVTSYFNLDSGQKNELYDHSQLVIKPQFANKLTSKPFVVASVDVFKTSTSAGIGFFSVDSYPTSNVSPTPNSFISWAEIPLYNSGSTVYDLRDCIDIRAVRLSTAQYSTDVAGATVNPPTTNQFIPGATSYLAEPDTNIITDVEYYLGRIDLIAIGASGSLSVVQGVPSENPRPPVVDVDAMSICTAYVSPFPTLSADEGNQYGRNDYAVSTKVSFNRVYTMRDIGVLDQRIQRLEYYTTLNLLEQKAKTTQVPDAQGNSRFKNGFFADPMNSHALADVANIEYRWSIDSLYGFGRPLYASENVNLNFNTNASTGVVQNGRYVTLPFTHERIIYQPFATKVRNNSQDAWSWKGTLGLYPSYDMNRDETLLPAIDNRIDLTQPFAEFANAVAEATGATVFGTRYGDWRTLSSDLNEWRTRSGMVATVHRIQTLQQERNVTNTFTVPVSQTIDLGTYVTDVSVQPYMKARTIAFVAYNLKPNTKVYAFFDDTPVSQYCAPGALNTDLGPDLQTIVENASQTGKLDSVCVRKGNFGDPLITDSTGALYGMFLVPGGQFRTGDRQLQIIDQDSLVTGADAIITRATATFTASNISVTKRDSTITTVTPSVRQNSWVDDRTVINDLSYSYIDPIAQSFQLDAPEQQSGVFVTKVDLFFKTKDPKFGMTVLLLGMTNNLPDYTKVYGKRYLTTDMIKLSDDATVPTTFEFEQPIFINAGDLYAFSIEPEANSPEFNMWMSEVGGYDITTGAQVYTNPYSGDAFRSSNAKTWTPLTREDIKFNLYCANFTVGSGQAMFENEDEEWFKYTDLVPFAANTSVRVGDDVFVVNSVANIAIVNTAISGIIQSIDENNTTYRIDSSTGGFNIGDTIGVFRLPQAVNAAAANASTLIASFTLSEFANPPLDAIVPSFTTMLPVGCSIGLSYAGTNASTGAKDDSYTEISMDTEKEMLDYERAVYSKSQEMSLVRTKSLTINCVFQNTNKYLTPVIDLMKKQALIIENKINNDATNEHTRYGNAIAKYISQTIVLADGQDAEDLKVYISAYRPFNTDILVYAKFLAGEDGSLFENKVWTKLDNDDVQMFCDPLNTTDFREFTYSVPTAPPVTYAAYLNQSNNNIIQYVDAGGAVFQRYKTFAIKIVLLSQDRIYVPKIDDLRAIALQV